MSRTFRDRVRGLYRALFPPGHSALGVAISVFVGVFIAVLPTIGFALPLTVLTTGLCRLPKGPGLVASFVATPPTLFTFFYPVSYLLGRELTGPPDAKLQLLSELQKLTPSTVYGIGQHLWQDSRAHVLAFLLGTLIVSLVTAAVAAALSYWVIARRNGAAPHSRQGLPLPTELP